MAEISAYPLAAPDYPWAVPDFTRGQCANCSLVMLQQTMRDLHVVHIYYKWLIVFSLTDCTLLFLNNQHPHQYHDKQAARINASQFWQKLKNFFEVPWSDFQEGACGKWLQRRTILWKGENVRNVCKKVLKSERSLTRMGLYSRSRCSPFPYTCKHVSNRGIPLKKKNSTEESCSTSRLQWKRYSLWSSLDGTGESV